MKRVLVGVSGGVDSSVAMLLLKQQGYDVEAVIFKQVNAVCNQDSLCCSASAIEEASAVCHQLGVQLHIKDLRQIFEQTVIKPTIEEYRKGTAPSPCITCNSNVRSVSLNYLRQVLSCDYFATGHYFNIDDGIVKRGMDILKDQSYMVSMVKKEYFKYWKTPLGQLVKPQVREIAAKHNLHTATNPDSQDLCFKHLLPKIERKLIYNGKIVGEYNGRPTVGQRKPFKGLTVISVNEDSIELSSNRIERRRCPIKSINWIDLPKIEKLDIQLRSHSKPVLGTIVDNEIILDNPEVLSPGQVAALYCDQQLIGGAIVG